MHPRPAIAIAIASTALASLLLITACDRSAPSMTDSPADVSTGQLHLAVSITPQAGLIRRIAGDSIGGKPVSIDVFVGAGQDPHHFSATPNQVMSLGAASAYFTIGMPFETALVEKLSASLPGIRIYHMAEGLQGVEEIDHGNEHDHADHADKHDDAHHADKHDDAPAAKEEAAESEAAHPGDHHDHDHDHGFDPHVWLSPPLLVGIARNIRDALTELDPANAALYSKNFDALKLELEALDEELAFTLEPCRGSAFFVYHPDFTHFAARYGLEQKAIEFEGKSPTPKQLMAVVQEARESRARVIFTQPQYDPASAHAVADAIGGTVKMIDPLAEDVLANLKEITLTLYHATVPE